MALFNNRIFHLVHIYHDIFMEILIVNSHFVYILALRANLVSHTTLPVGPVQFYLIAVTSTQCCENGCQVPNLALGKLAWHLAKFSWHLATFSLFKKVSLAPGKFVQIAPKSHHFNPKFPNFSGGDPPYTL